MVEFVDGSIKAQLGNPDMRGPIRYALADATHPTSLYPGLDFSTISSLTFEQPDTSRFPAITLAQLALERGGLIPCVINAANEIAVASFLEEKMRFVDIYPTIINAVDKFNDDIINPSYEDYVECNSITRKRTTEYIDSMTTLHTKNI